MDLKLGARLWDDSAPPAKRTRLDTVAQSTTSASLGFRLAGMRVWEGPPRPSANGDASLPTDGQSEKPLSTYADDTGYRFYNKLFGRSLTPSTLPAALRTFLHVPSANIDIDIASKLAHAIYAEISQILQILERTEVRLVSSSILVTYEGDGAAFRAREERLRQLAEDKDVTEHEHEGDTDDEEDEEPVLYRVKLIDFAHARFTPGRGADENILPGVRNIEREIRALCDELMSADTSHGT